MAETIAIESIPEVLDYMDAKENLEAFYARNPALIAELRSLAEDYNTKLQAAEKVVRGKMVTCGPFDQYQTSVSYDPEKLFNALGRTGFLKIGGTVRTVSEYVIDKKSVEAAIAKQAIPEEVLETVAKVKRNYHVPDPVVLP